MQPVTSQILEFARQELSFLRHAHTTVLFGVSQSVAGASWQFQEQILTGITQTAAQYNDDGIRLVAIENENLKRSPPATAGPRAKDNVKDAATVNEFLNGFQLKILMTPTSPVLRGELNKHIEKCTENHNHKHLNLVIITHGFTNRTYNQMTITGLIESTIFALKDLGFDPKEKLRITFVLVTTNIAAMAAYRKLGQQCEWTRGEETLKCDLVKVIYKADISAMGGTESEFAISVILAGNCTTPLDEEFKMGDEDMKEIDEYILNNHHLDV
jgi:hypothetical protein